MYTIIWQFYEEPWYFIFKGTVHQLQLTALENSHENHRTVEYVNQFHSRFAGSIRTAPPLCCIPVRRSRSCCHCYSLGPYSFTSIFAVELKKIMNFLWKAFGAASCWASRKQFLSIWPMRQRLAFVPAISHEVYVFRPVVPPRRKISDFSNLSGSVKAVRIETNTRTHNSAIWRPYSGLHEPTTQSAIIPGT